MERMKKKTSDDAMCAASEENEKVLWFDSKDGSWLWANKKNGTPLSKEPILRNACTVRKKGRD